MNDQLPTPRQLKDEAQRLAGDIVGGHGIDDANMTCDEVRSLTKTFEGRERFGRYKAECEQAAERFGDMARWDAALLHSAVPRLRRRQARSLWRHLFLSASIEAHKRSRTLEERATRAARVALSGLPGAWDHFGTDALLEARKYVEQEHVRAQQSLRTRRGRRMQEKMRDGGLSPRCAAAALLALDEVLAGRLGS
ncbi:MAG: hypothetical protein ABIQ73_10085 [Acidimicrobiales bacterium]